MSPRNGNITQNNSEWSRRDVLRLGRDLVFGGAAAISAYKLGQLLPPAGAAEGSVYHPSEVPKVQLNRAPHPIAIDGKWKDDWNNATLIDIINRLPSKGYTNKYAGQSGYAYSRFMQNEDWLYGNIEYLPPVDDAGKRDFNPYWVAIYIDSNGDKNNVPINDDYYFLLLPTNSNFFNREGFYYKVGTGNTSKVDLMWAPTGSTPGNKMDASDGVSAFSIISTPTFENLHPYYEFSISKKKFGIHNPFGLGILVYDTHIIQKQNSEAYVATFPQNDIGYSMPNISFSPQVWANAYSSEAITTQTIISSLTSKSTETPPITSSTSISRTETSITKTDFDSLQTLIEVLLGGGSIAGISAYGLYRYFKRNRSKAHQSNS